MTELNFTLQYDFFIGLMSDSKDEAFAKLMKAILDQVLLAESKEQLGAADYERSSDRKDYRNGTRERTMTTRIGKIVLEVPRHRNMPFSSALFEAYQRNEKALILAMIEMVIQGVSTRKVQKITEELCGATFQKSVVSEMCRNLDVEVSDFKNRRLDTKYPFVFVDAIYIKVREDGRIRSKGFLWALGINSDGRKEVLGFHCCNGETKDSWTGFFNSLKARGLSNVDIITSDSHQGLVAAVRECFQGTAWQRCQVHFQRNVSDKCPKKYQAAITTEIREMFGALTIEAARAKKEEIIKEYEDVAPSAMSILDQGFEDTMAVMALPMKYRTSVRTTNIIERENREIRRRESVIQIFPNEDSTIRLIGAVLMDHHENWIAGHRVFDMKEYFEERENVKQKLKFINKTA